MDGLPDIRSLRISSLPTRTRRLLSILMNSPKIIPSDGPDRLPRDWRGLAYLVRISSEEAASFQDSNDKTSKVLEVWMRNTTANLGQLLDFLQRLDRYDVYDDLCKDVREHYKIGDLVVNQSNQLQLKNNQVALVDEWDNAGVITVHDREGYLHHYDAFVLYAEQDQSFVDEICTRMSAHGFELCTKDNILPCYATQYKPVSHLISERCKHIILIFSPDFLRSHAESFFTDYAQAVSIESNGKKIIPVMYRECILPPHHSMYFMLRYTDSGRAMYNFWSRLICTLELGRRPGVYVTNSVNSGLNIVELPSESEEYDERCFLPRSISVNNIHSVTMPAEDTGSLDNVTQIGVDKKKKSGTLKKLFNTFKGKKSKKEMVERIKEQHSELQKTGYDRVIDRIAKNKV